MANLSRSAKSGSDWTQNELDCYNIIVTEQSKQEFFGTDNLPVPNYPSLAGFLSIQDRVNAADPDAKRLLHYLDLALDPHVGQETAVENFAANLLERLGYDDGDRIIFIHHALPLVICGVTSVAQTDICILDDNNTIFLLVQEDNRLTSWKDPEPQVIAEAIAAYAINNRRRSENLRLTPLPSITIPAITMAGTNPVFYKIPVTAELSEAVRRGTYPATETRVLKYVPVLPRRRSLGMRPLENRVELLACLEAFRQFIGH